jgi:hypothetical protein
MVKKIISKMEEAERIRKWRLENPERYKEIQKKSRENCKERIKKAMEKWRNENRLRYREIVNKSAKKYNKTNPEKSRENRLNHKFQYDVRDFTKRHFKKEEVCGICKDNKNLEFHHFIYKTPVERKDFTTLCGECHNIQHGGLKIGCN